MKILSFRKYEKDGLLGFTDVQLSSGMVIRDLTLHEKDGSRWVGYPAKPYRDNEGNTKYQNIIYFPDKKVHAAFQQKILTALDSYFATNRAEDPGDVPFE